MPDFKDSPPVRQPRRLSAPPEPKPTLAPAPAPAPLPTPKLTRFKDGADIEWEMNTVTGLATRITPRPSRSAVAPRDAGPVTMRFRLPMSKQEAAGDTVLSYLAAERPRSPQEAERLLRTGFTMLTPDQIANYLRLWFTAPAVRRTG